MGIPGDGKLFDESPIHQIECLFSRGAEPRRFPGRFTPSSTDGTGRVGRALLIAVERPACEYRGQGRIALHGVTIITNGYSILGGP